jgi:hypothetical protein
VDDASTDGAHGEGAAEVVQDSVRARFSAVVDVRCHDS